MYRRLIAVMTLLLSVTAFAKEAATPLDSFVSSIRRKTLPNGLTVIARETPGTGVVAINTWVKAGYFNEPDEVAGMAHLFEHMLFKSSKNFPQVEQVSQEVASLGGATNAGTIYDTTNYYFVMPKEGFRRGLDLQVDAIANPIFDAAELKKEAEVVIEESNRKRDNPPAMAAELMYATAFTQHRMKRWRIGSNEVLRNVKRENLAAFFETLYRPENMILVVVGDVPAEEVFRGAEATFGKIAKGKLDKKRGPVEPQQTEFRYGQSSADIRQGYTEIGWHTPGVNNPDEIALGALSTILGGGRSSRFFRNVVAPDAASTAYAQNSTFGDVGMFEVQASFDEKNRAEADRRLMREIERIKASGPTAAELQLAKNLTESQLVLSMQDVLGQAEAIGGAETRGGASAIAGDLAKLNALTADDITRVARKYLTLENMTLYHYRPKGSPEMTRDQALAFVREAIANVPATAAATTVTAPAAPQPVRGARGLRAPEVSKLSNGATLIVEERAGTPVISASVYFRGGRSFENSANAGITRLMAASMRRGTSTRSGEEIDRQIEFLGTQIGLDTQRDYFGFFTEVVSRNVRPAVALMSDIVLNPTFAANGINEEKALQKAAIRRNSDSAQARPVQLLYEAMFRNHPYALTAEGYTTSVDTLDVNALRSWWSQNVTADDAVVVLVGDIHADDAKQLAEEMFSKLPKRTAPRAANAMPLVAAGRADSIEYREKKQSAIAIGFPAVRFSDPDYVPLRLLQTITSGISGTLFSELRGKRSLAYTVFSNIQPSEQGGVYLAYMGTEAAKEEQARTGLLTELRRHAQDAVDEERLARAKSTLSGNTRLQRQTNAAHALENVRNYYFNLGLDFTDRFLAQAQQQSLDAVKTAVQKYLGSENYVVAIVRGKS
ncbi:MAG: insulinase family protein [Acidobacteriota bacterium]|nr:insulinase family protein [Acidobacteriota bacterium]